MKIVIDIEVNTDEQSANLVGEILREETFAEGLGCYYCFDIKPHFEKMDNKEAVALVAKDWWGGIPDEADFMAAGAYEELLERLEAFSGPDYNVAWYWDGDGTLLFWKEHDFAVINNDCKKSYGWEFIGA